MRVAIVQPGIIDTPMARDIEHVHTDPVYPHVRRFGDMFEASLDTPTPPTIVAEKIREIVESDTRTLRHPVGPDAEGFLAWRASQTEDAWAEWGACPMRRGTTACVASPGSMCAPSGTRARQYRQAAFASSDPLIRSTAVGGTGARSAERSSSVRLTAPAARDSAA